jgi:hypothetical protein
MRRLRPLPVLYKWGDLLELVVAVIHPFTATSVDMSHKEEGDGTVMMRDTFILCLWMQMMYVEWAVSTCMFVDP